MKLQIIFIFVTSLSLIQRCSSVCNRKPQGATGEPSAVDENFYILIDGNPSTYILGQSYNLSLSCMMGTNFKSFTLVVETYNESVSSSKTPDVLGHFEISDTVETRFNAFCENMLESSTINNKQRIGVKWIAPNYIQSSCVVFKAAVLQQRYVWFMDDGFLIKRLCPEEIDEVNRQTSLVDPCCACDEAKYEVVLERKWSRNTHARYFPKETWRTSIGEIVGATHTNVYHFWQYGGYASQGLQELAEHGFTKVLEDEIKDNLKTGHVRTIIKANGIKYHPNSQRTTTATARVDAKHHILSLVTKIDPSPDWILGVADLELCLRNCIWLDNKTLNLYPWDVGTDSGASYLSPNQPQIPPDVIRRITSQTTDQRSPFFDQNGISLKPLATLHLKRQKVYQRNCNNDIEEPLECSTYPWNNWSECSMKCGAGVKYRERFFKDPKLAKNYNCQTILRETLECLGDQCGLSYNLQLTSTRTAAECELTAWTKWTECSKKCGRGVQKRFREFVNDYTQDRCQNITKQKLLETRACYGDNCGGSINNSYDNLNFDSNEQELEEQLLPNEKTKLNRKYSSTSSQDQGFNKKDFLRGHSLKQTEGINDYRNQTLQSNKLPDCCLTKPQAPLHNCNKKRISFKNYWFYDVEDSQCKLFTADNCDETPNKFRSLEVCELKCLKH